MTSFNIFENVYENECLEARWEWDFVGPFRRSLEAEENGREEGEKLFQSAAD